MSYLACLQGSLHETWPVKLQNNPSSKQPLPEPKLTQICVYPSWRVLRSFGIFVAVDLSRLMNKRSSCWWIETSWASIISSLWLIDFHPSTPDPLFLLRYLRTAKFDQQKARERLLNHTGLLSKRRSWFGNVDPLDPAVQAVIDSRWGLKRKYHLSKFRREIYVSMYASDWLR